MNKISNRIVRPAQSKDLPAKRGGDFLIVAKGNFYTPDFYKGLKNAIQHWKDEDDFGDFSSVTQDLTLLDQDEWNVGGIELLN